MTEVERLRKARGLSKAELARRIDMSVNTIYRMELPSEQRAFGGTIGLETALKVCAVLDAGLVEAFQGEMLTYPSGFHYLIVGTPASAE